MNRMQKCRCGKPIRSGALCGGCHRAATRDRLKTLAAERSRQVLDMVQMDANPLLSKAAAEQLARAWGVKLGRA